MEIQYGKQVYIKDIQNKVIDIFVCAENHEKRSYTLFNNLTSKSSISVALVFCYKEEIVCVNKSGVDKFKVNNHSDIYNLIDIEIKQIEKEEIVIVIDYSCMTKSWYYSIILYLKNKNIQKKRLLVYFSYTPAKFIEPKEPKPNKEIGPLPGKYVVPTDKPKALIVCLGYEQNKAEGIIEHLDPKISYLFYTDPATDKSFLLHLKKNNERLIEEKSEHLISYPFNNLRQLEKELTTLYYKLRDEYSIIIAPLGPKPFTFISMLMAAKYNEIDIWRVGSGSDINEYENEPIDDKSFIICEVFLESDNDYFYFNLK